MSNIKERMESAAEEFVRKGDCEVMDTYMAHEDTHKAGYRSGFTDPEVIALVDVVRYMITAINNGDDLVLFPAEMTLTAYQSSKQELEREG